jgi:hypothetical protein
MRYLATYLVSVFSLLTIAGFSQSRSFVLPTQKWVEESGSIQFPTGNISPRLDEKAFREAAKKFAASALHLQDADLQIEHYITSPIGRHISFVQYWKGVPIFGTSAKLNVAPDGKITSLFSKVVSTKNWSSGLLSIAPQKVRLQGFAGSNEISHYENVWYYAGEGDPVAAIELEYGTYDATVHKLAVLDQNYQVIYSLDKHRHFDNPTDSSVTAYVFMPDPLTSAQTVYGGKYQDFDDSAVYALDFQRVPVDIRVKYENGKFTLDGPYAYLRDVQKPTTPETYSTIPLFNFSRHDPGFEDVNAFYHIHVFQKYIQSLGFMLGNIPLKVDAHAEGGDDQSEFDFFDKNDLKLLYGTGGVDDAEDADVIVHEYGHFLSYMAAGDNAYGSERLALEEGLCDYFACSYSKALSKYRWERLYSWDGNNQYWPGRSCVTVKQYPADLKGNRWADGEFWAGTLMEIQEELGRAMTDKLMLATLYSFGKNISMSTAAMLFIQADSILNGGANYAVIKSKFVNHGILTWNVGVEENAPKLVSAKVYIANENAIVELGKPSSGNITLYDMQGRRLLTQAFGTTSRITLPIDALASGVYLVQVQIQNQTTGLKLVKP